jgi:hypothetical protein
VSLQDRSTSAIKVDLDALDEMSKSRGWQVLVEYIHGEAQRAVMAMGKMGMSQDEAAFRRGAIYASQNVINAPSQLLAVMATELLMRKGEEVASPAPSVLGE